METPPHHHHQLHPDKDLGNKSNGSSSSNYLCRQSSTRWTPTSDQIRILKELYYTNGIRSPTADQIQRIAARLREYGKIEGKNVFYWFQNHKARERQKKRFTPSAASAAAAAQAPPSSTTTNLLPPPFADHPHHHINYHNSAMHIQPHHLHNQEPSNVYSHQHKLYTTHLISPAGVGSSSSSQGMVAVGCGYGSAAMEKSFRECSISPGGNHNYGSWVDVDSYSFFDKIKPETYDNEQETLEEEERDPGEIETLPLFPISGEATTTHHDFFNMKTTEPSSDHTGGYYTGGNWYRSDGHGRTSLELSLNSYGYYN